MKQTKTLLKIILLSVLVFNVILCGAVQAANIPEGYTSVRAQGSGITADTTLEQASAVNFKMDFISDDYTYTARNNKIIKDGDYLCYTLPNEDISNLDETLTVTCKDAAVDWQGTRYDLRIIIDNMVANGYNKSKGNNKKLRIFTITGSGSDRAPWIEAYLASGSFTNIFDSVTYDVTMQIIDKAGKVQSGTFVYAVKDLDISSKFGYGDASEGVTLLSGFDLKTLKVRTNSTLCYKYVNGNLRITGTQSNNYTDRNASSETAGTEAGFSVIANASGTKFNWSGGRNCGTALCDFGQPDTLTPDDSTIIVRYLEEGTNKELATSTTATPGTSVTKKDISNYIYTGVQVDDGTKKTDNSTITPDDSKPHEIIFWYKETPKVPNVTVKYVALAKATDAFSKGTNVITPKTIALDSNKTFKSSQITETGKNYDYVGVSVDGNTPTQNTEVTITNDGKDHEVVFAYVQTINIKVIGVCTQNGKSKQFAFEQNVSVPVNKTYKATSYQWPGYKLVSGNNTRVIQGKLAWLGETADKSGGIANVVVSAADYSNTTKNNLVVFYYESNLKATVRHIYVNPLTQEETILETSTASIVPDVTKTISSKKFSNYINLSYGSDPSVTITPNGFVKFGDGIYTISFVPGENNYTIEFRYTSQIIEVRHEYADGTSVIPPVTKILDPNHPESPLTTKEPVYYQLNNGPKQQPATVKVPIQPGQEKQTLVFVYTSPYLIFGEDDPNPDHPYYPDGGSYTNTRKKYNTGIFPNKMNNQFIGQSDSIYYWVLDEKGELTIRLAFKHMNNGTATTTVSIKIPFDVSVNGTLVSANTPISVNLTRKAENDDGCEVWEGKLSNILVPIWTQEKEYTIEAVANYTHVASDGFTTSITGTATAKVTVIGAVYDFSVTNVDGSTTTGDAMWKTSLITNPILAVAKKSNGVVEYETNILPIGQANQQNAKYNYGLKKGTRFYFSVNTKGAKSTAIEITPRFYYFDKAGNVGNNGNPVTVRSGNTDITTLTRTTTLTDANRTTAEYQKELATGRTLYGANTYSNARPTVFANKVITIGTGLRTPFVNYGKDPTSTKYHEVSVLTDTNRVYRNASHWYADYVIPNNATFFDSNNKQLPADGYLVVGFSIRTKAGNDAYLAYNLNSPFTTTKQSEWAYEGAPANYTLPKTATLTAGKAVTPWLRNVVTTVSNPSAYAPVVIYQGNLATTQNVDSTGTH